MRHLFIGLALIASLITKNSFANEADVPSTVLNSFHYIFGSSTDVKWTELNGIYKAEFTIGKEKVSEFFDAQGEVVAIGLYIKLSDLPEKLAANLSARAATSKIAEIFEVSDTERSTYYVTLISDHSEMVLYSSGNTWKEFKKPNRK